MLKANLLRIGLKPEAVVSESLSLLVGVLVFKFTEPPIASASIAQVHTARLHNGDEVVVKIQRPGIAERLAPDVAILERLASLAEISEYGRMLSARHVVEDFADGLDAELDFRNEADAMREWYECLKPGQFGDRVRVPYVYDDLTTARVMTMERIYATRIDDAAAVRAAGHDGVALCRNLLLSLLESAFHGGLFHGDLHAGNVLVDADGVRLHYLERGEGLPLVLLHGNGSMIQDFVSSGLVDLAARQHRVIVFDRPGYGHSPRPRGRVWSPQAQADLFRAALERLGVSQAVIMGHSWGQRLPWQWR